MTTYIPLSPSPRRPLQTLSNNALTPKQSLANQMSPFKAHVSHIPTTLCAIKETTPIVTSELNASRKRTFEELSSADQRDGSSQTRASFSSLIDYHAHSQTDTEADETVMDEIVEEEQEDVEETRIKSRADVLKLRLQMALYRVQTNQVNIPFLDLQVPIPPRPEPQLLLDPLLAPFSPRTPGRRVHAGSDDDDDNDLPQQAVAGLRRTDGDVDVKRGDELSSSAVKGRAVTGLLGLRKFG